MADKIKAMADLKVDIKSIQAQMEPFQMQIMEKDMQCQSILWEESEELKGLLAKFWNTEELRGKYSAETRCNVLGTLAVDEKGDVR